jgi:hypothetical protein
MPVCASAGFGSGAASALHAFAFVLRMPFAAGSTATFVGKFANVLARLGKPDLSCLRLDDQLYRFSIVVLDGHAGNLGKLPRHSLYVARNI